MSKSSTASTPKTSSQLPSKSAWARGPPANTATAPSTRPQSPAPSAAAPSAPPTHSRRPSTLGQGVAFKDGVGARNPSNAAKTGSSVTFGSIDDASAPISSSPAAVPTLKPDGIKSFGTLPATSTNGKGHTRTTSFSTGTPPSVAASTSGTSSTPSTSSAAASGSASTPKHPKFDVKSLFQKPSQDGPSTSSSTADVTSPANRSAPLPHSSLGPQGQHPVHQSQPSQMGAPYPNFRPQQNGSVSSPGVPRSPSFSRQMANGNVNGRPPSQQGGPPSATLPSAMPSPRMGPPHSGQPPPVPPGGPVPMPQWTGYYYYPGMPVDPNYYPHTPQGHWMPPPHMPQQPHPPQGPPGSIPGMPMSPRGQQPSLHPPGTPTMQPAMPPNAHPQHPSPSPHMHTSSLSSISSTPSTPASSTAPGGGISRLNSNASSFTPKRVVIKSESGQEVDLERFKKQAPAVSSPVVPNSPARRPVSVRIETEDAKRKRMAEEEAAKRKEKEAEESKKKEAEDKARREEEARKKEEAEVQKKKEEEERRKKEEEERIRKETEEKERLRKEAEEKERQAREAEEKVRKEEEERKRKEEETRVAKEADELAKAAAAVAAEAKPEPSEEGEVQEPLDAADEAAKEEAKDKVPDKASLRIDTSLTPGDGKRRPGRLDLSSTKSNAIPAPLPSALATARIIEDIGSIAYPEGISSPKPELNVNAKQGKFRYDRDFLLQFMAVCKEKPDSLPPLDAIGLEPVDGYTITRGGSQNHGRRPSSTAMPPPSSTTSRQPPVGLGISSFSKNVNPFTMGQFSTPKSSEERFAAASRSASMSGGPAGLPFGRPAPMVRSSSQGGPGGSGRTRSQRGNKRGQDRPGGGQSGQGNSYGPAGSSLANAMSLEPVAPLEVSANRWTPASLVKKGPVVEQDSPEVVDRKVRALLNKLTMERFDTISDQIIAWANKSEKEQDGRTLIQVIRLVFEKATDEATWSEMYARLCRKMMEQISPNVRDDGIKNTEGKPIAGGQLFRKYLLNRCQEDFERGWAAKDATAAAAATKATEDHAAKAAAEANKGAEGEGESALYSEEYYAAQKAKRQGLGLIKFIGELFKLQMLTERIMHECVKKLLGNVENPEEEEIESLCKLLTTVGQILDTPKARAHMDVYFSRMKELTRSANVNSRMQFMLQDVIELRDRKWIPRNLASAPTTIAALREQIEKEKIAQEKDAMNRTLSMSRGGSRRGGERGDHQQIGPDGWAVAGGATPRQPKAGDLSQFGKISKAAPMTFGPSSVFQKDKTKSRESTLSRQGSTNMFSMLNSEMPTEAATSKSSRPPSRKNSIDLGPGGAPDAAPQQRKRLQLLPRSVPVDSKSESTPAGSTAGSDDDAAESTVGASMSVEEANVQIKEDLKEFFSVRNLEEAEVYFTKLPVEHRHLLVDKLVTHAVESKEDDAKLVASLFDLAHAKNLCSPATFEEGFAPTAEIIDDVAIDAPKAFNLFAIMLKGAHLHEDEERGARLASKSMDSDKLLSLLSS